MFDGLLGCALVFYDDLSAVLGDLLGVVGIGKALGHCAEQLFFVVHEDGAVVGEKGLDGLLEIEGVRAEDSAFAERCGFHHIGAAHRHE